MKKALVYFPYSVFPVESGGQWRCASLIEALKSCGYRVTLVTAGKISQDEKLAAQKAGVHSWLSPTRPPWLRRKHHQLMRIFRKGPRRKHPSENLALTDVLRLVAREHGSFDLLLINYTNNGWVRDFIDAPIKILDTLDLLSVSEKMIQLATQLIVVENNKVIRWNSDFLDLNCYESVRVEATEEEASQCEGYDSVLMIAEKETEAINSKKPDIPVRLLAPSAPQNIRKGDHDGLPIFASGPNIFNVQGLIAFQEQILPIILHEAPDFKLDVTGTFRYDISFTPQVKYLGLVPNINTVYQDAGFAIVPTFGGTGQQLKVVEAMGAGLPVVAYKQRIDRGIITDGTDGFLAEDEADFAAKVLQLWRDPKLRKTMGKAAKQKIDQQFSQNSTNFRLKEILSEIESRQ